MRNLTILISSFFIYTNSFCQDPHFSQFFASPITLNPAFTGKFDGNIRIAGNYRNQWPTINRAFETKTAAVDFMIMKNKIAANDTWGIGFLGYSDKGANGAVNFNYYSFSTAYHKGLDEEGYHQIGTAFMGTYANMNINVNSLKFADQLTPFGFTGLTTELFDNTTLQNNYLDLSAGILYNGSTSDKNNFYAGVSMFHINRPKQQFTGSNFNLDPRVSFHAGTNFPVGYNSSLHMSMLYSSQGKANETVLGGAIDFLLIDNGINQSHIYAGSWFRLKDAIIPYVGLEWGNYRLGVTYDISSSALKTASQNRGGIEVSLIYIAKPSDSKGINCPKF